MRKPTLLVLLLCALPVFADVHLAEGEIRRVDKDAGRITIRHGEIKSLDMPAMTMVFRVKDPSLLEKVKAGDRVKFATEKVGGSYYVTDMAPAK